MITRTKLGHLIKCRLKLKAQEILQMCQLYTPKSDFKWQRAFVCSTSNWSNVDYNLNPSKKYNKRVSCIYPKIRLQMTTSVYVSDQWSDFKLIKCQLNLNLRKYYKRVSCIHPKVRLQMATSVYVSDQWSDFKLIKCRLKLKAQEILQTCQL